MFRSRPLFRSLSFWTEAPRTRILQGGAQPEAPGGHTAGQVRTWRVTRLEPRRLRPQADTANGGAGAGPAGAAAWEALKLEPSVPRPDFRTSATSRILVCGVFVSSWLLQVSDPSGPKRCAGDYSEENGEPGTTASAARAGDPRMGQDLGVGDPSAFPE